MDKLKIILVVLILSSISNFKAQTKTELFKTIKAGLTFIASQATNRGQSVIIPLTVKNNFIFLGPIIVGKIDDKLFM